MQPQKKVPIEEVCRILELPVTSWTLEHYMDREEAEKCVQDFKDLVKKQRKTLAKKYHPDMPTGDELRMKEINDMVDVVNKLVITKIPQRPQAQNIRFHFAMNPFGERSTQGSTQFDFRTFS